jgi:hypothetical protein
MNLTKLEGKIRKYFYGMREKWRNSRDGREERNCWHGSKMATETKKAFGVLEFHSTNYVTTIQRGFRRKFHKILHVWIHFAFSGSVAILLPCQ